MLPQTTANLTFFTRRAPLIIASKEVRLIHINLRAPHKQALQTNIKNIKKLSSIDLRVSYPEYLVEEGDQYTRTTLRELEHYKNDNNFAGANPFLFGKAHDSSKNIWVSWYDIVGTFVFEGCNDGSTKLVFGLSKDFEKEMQNLINFLQEGRFSIRCVLRSDWGVRVISNCPNPAYTLDSPAYFRREDVNLAQIYGQALQHIFLDKKERAKQLDGVGITPSTLLTTLIDFALPALEVLSPAYVGVSGIREEHQTVIPILLKFQHALRTTSGKSANTIKLLLDANPFTAQIMAITKHLRSKNTMHTPLLQFITHKLYTDYEGLHAFFCPTDYIDNKLVKIVDKVKVRYPEYTTIDNDLDYIKEWGNWFTLKAPFVNSKQYARWHKLRTHKQYYSDFVIPRMQECANHTFSWQEVRKTINDSVDIEIQKLSNAETHPPFPVTHLWGINALNLLKQVLADKKKWSQEDRNRIVNRDNWEELAQDYADERMPTGLNNVVNSLRISTLILIKAGRVQNEEPISLLEGLYRT